MLLLWLITGARAATLVVGPGGYASIQDAVDAASDGDTLEITAGTWQESVVIDKDLVLVGLDAPDATWLASEATALTVWGADVTACSVTVAGGARGIDVQGGRLSLCDAVVTGVRHGGDGGGVRVEGGALYLDDVVFEDNRVDTSRGGHVYALDALVEIEECTFTDGRGHEGGGLYVEGGSLEVVDSTFSGHTVRADDEAGASAGGAIRLVETSAVLTRIGLEDNSVSEGTGGHLAALDSTVTLEDSTLTGGLASGYDGGALTADGGSLEVEGCTLSGNAAVYAEDGTTAHGGGIRITGGASWSVVDTAFTSNVGEGWGGAMSVDSGPGSVQGCTFEGNYAYYGAGAYLRATEDAAVRDSTFEGNEARYGAGLRWIPSSTSTELEVSGCTFTDNTVSGYGGVIYARNGGTLRYIGNTATGHSADVGGVLMLWTLETAEIQGNTFCYNRARTEDYSDGGAVNLYYVDDAVLENNAFVENRADEWGGAISAQRGETLRVANNTFLGNTSRSEGQGGGVGIRTTDEATLVNNVFAWTLGGGAVSSDDAEVVSITWSDWWENLESDLGWALEPVELGEEHLFVDPDVVQWSADRDCAEDVLWLSWRSDLRDAGDPDLLDPDGTRSDMGAFGGPGADPALFEDGDADGHPLIYDCDDDSEDTWPGAEEIPYDGVDQDCDGSDLTDVDGDFHDAETAGGDDCDDADPTVHPGVEDRWYDGVDSDCDGADDYDLDGDGHAHDGYGGDDCDDGDPATHPGAADIPGDGIDQDCDGEDATPETDEDPGCGGCASPGGPTSAWLALLLLLSPLPSGTSWRRRSQW